MLEKLKALMALCGSYVSLAINQHIADYSDAGWYLDETLSQRHVDPEDVVGTVEDMIAANQIVELQFYLNGGGHSFIYLIGADIEAVLDEGLRIVQELQRQ